MAQRPFEGVPQGAAKGYDEKSALPNGVFQPSKTLTYLIVLSKQNNPTLDSKRRLPLDA